MVCLKLLYSTLRGEFSPCRPIGRIAAIHIILGLCAAVTPAVGATPPVVSLVVASTAPIYNQMGIILQGNEPGREDLGLHYIRGCLVQILSAPSGVIYPPETDGQPNPLNALLQVTFIGYGTGPQQEDPGQFATTLTPRPSQGVKIFIRVFNQPSLETASFYSDSSLFAVSQTEDIPFISNIPHTSNPIDPADNDGDGLNNSWERWNGSNPDLADTDGDGFDDKAEFHVGTDSDDMNSLLQIVDISIDASNHITLLYSAGKNHPANYEHATNINVFSEYSDISTVVNSSSGYLSVELPAMDDNGVQVFRLKVHVNEM